MELFLKLLQGSYAYLLIFQVVVVSLLLLSLLWLIVKRMREGIGASPFGSVAIGAHMEPVADLPAGESKSKSGAAASVEGSELTAATEQAGKMLDENKALNEKVKYLESRLLEYEILQEEIGTLSALKLENEQLRARLGMGGDATGASPAPSTETPSAPPAEKAPPSTSEAKSATPAASGADNQNPDDLNALLQEIDKLATKPTASKPR